LPKILFKILTPLGLFCNEGGIVMGPFMDVSGSWDIVQSSGFRVRITVFQTNDQLTATASHSAGTVLSLDATGSVRGPEFDITITWKNGTKGQYHGTFTRGIADSPPNGFLKGHAKDLFHPGSEADWFSEGRVFQFA
jgi:hypothetical protein